MNQAWLVIGWKGQGIRKLASMFFAWLARYIVLPPIIKKKKEQRRKSGFKEEIWGVQLSTV